MSKKTVNKKLAPGTTTAKPKTKPIKMVKVTACIPEGRKTLTIFLDRFKVPVLEEIMFHKGTQFRASDVGKLTRWGNNLSPMVGMITTDELLNDSVEKVKAQFLDPKFSEGLGVLQKNLEIERKHQDKRINQMLDVVSSGKSRIEDITNFKPTKPKKGTDRNGTGKK